MSGLIGALRATLGLNTANFEAGSKRARREAITTATVIQRSLGSIKGAFGGLGSALVGGATIAGLAALTKRSLEYASSLAEVAQQVGVTAKDLQVLRFAGSQVGISTEEMDKGLQKFTKSLGDARNGSAEAIKTFKALGFTDADIKHLDVHDALMKTADGIAGVGDRAMRASPEVRLFGKAGQQLDTLLSQGSRGVNELAASAEKLGVVLSDEQIRHADETADKLSALKQVLEARIAGVVADNAESILALATSLASLAGGLAKFWAQDPVKAVGILGALAGASIGARVSGVPGALVGGGIGLILGRGAGSQTEAGMRQRAEGFRQNAQMIGRNRGFFKPGITQAEKDQILKDPGIQANLKQFRHYMAEAAKMATGGSIATPSSTSTPSGGNLGNFLASPSKSGKSGDQLAAERERLEKERLATAHEMAQRDIQGQEELLQAQEDVTSDYEKRAELALQQVDLEQKARDEEIDYNLATIEADRTISAGQKQEAERQAQKDHELNAQISALHRQAITDEVAAQKREDALQRLETSLDIQQDTLQLEEGLADTARERRDIELRLLEIAERQERARLEAVLADEKSSKAAKEEAQARLNALSAQHDLKVQGIVAQTRGPLETFQAGLPTTADKMNEALQNVVVNGLGGLEQGILDVIDGTKSLGQAFHDMASQIIAELIRIQIQKAILAPVSNFLGGLLGGVGGATAGLNFGGTDVASMMALNPGLFATGGWTGGIPAHKIAGFVHGREYVFDAAATNRIGVGNLDALRRGLPMPANDAGMRGGDVYHLHLQAPNTGDAKRDRQSMYQQASILQARLTTAKRRGY